MNLENATCRSRGQQLVTVLHIDVDTLVLLQTSSYRFSFKKRRI